MLNHVNAGFPGNRLPLHRFRAGNNIAAEPLVMHGWTSSPSWIAMTAPLAAQKPVLAGKPTKAAIEGRFYIEDVYPSVDTGRFAVKRIVGEPIEVSADVVRDGHDVLATQFIWRRERERSWLRMPMRLYSNDRWTATFV